MGDEDAPEASDEAPFIRVNRNGSYYVKGQIRLLDPEGNEFPAEDERWLCRCGDSKTKPFCDGTHKTSGFESVVSAPES